MQRISPISEVKARLAEIVRDSDSDDVVLMKHGHPVAVVMSYARHEALVDQIEDLTDCFSIHERDGLTMDYAKLSAELGLDED